MILIDSLKVSSILLAMPLLFIFLGQSSSCRTSKATTNETKDNTVTKETIVTKEDGRIRIGDNAGADVWGGEHIRLQVTGQGAEIEYDCAQGKMEKPPVADAGGRFDIKGTHRAEHPGPIRRDEEESGGRPARYTGKIAGDTMTLTVLLTDKSETFGTFTLRRGNEGNVFKCK